MLAFKFILFFVLIMIPLQTFSNNECQKSMGVFHSLAQKAKVFIGQRNSRKLVNQTKEQMQRLEKMIERPSVNISIEQVIDVIRRVSDPHFLSDSSIHFEPTPRLLQLMDANRDLTTEEESEVIESYHTIIRDLLTILYNDAKTHVESQSVTDLWYQEFVVNVEETLSLLHLSMTYEMIQMANERQQQMRERSQQN